MVTVNEEKTIGQRSLTMESARNGPAYMEQAPTRPECPNVREDTFEPL